MIFVGDDWAEAHHDVHLMNEAGDRLAARRLPEGLEGIRRFHELVAGHADDPGEVVVGIETDRGLWVHALVAAGYQVYAINPLAVARYRDRHNVAGAKSDAGDAKVLADLVRTDRHNHRPIAGDSPDAEAVKVLARGHQNLIWARTRHTNQLRNALREYYPAALEAFDDLADRDALAVLARAPTPDSGRRAVDQPDPRGAQARRPATQPRPARRARSRRRCAASSSPLRRRSPRRSPRRPTRRSAIIAELNRQIAELETTLADRFEQHPDADIYLSLPGLGVVLGARALGEFGDDPDRYATAKSRKNYAGTSPLTIASGKKRAVLARHVRNRRLYDAIDQWAFCALTDQPRLPQRSTTNDRAAGDLHHQALRALGNRLVGILHGCLRTPHPLRRTHRLGTPPTTPNDDIAA